MNNGPDSEINELMNSFDEGDFASIETIKEDIEKLKDNDIDKYEIASALSEMIKPIGSRTEELRKHTGGGTYAWSFNYDPTSSPREINITFLGTGSMPYFMEHAVMSRGGDVLCRYALQKALGKNPAPSMIMKGLGTAKLDANDNNGINLDEQYYPLHSLLDTNSDYVGGVGGNLLGRGIETRLKIAMEEFLIPQLFELTQKNKNLIDNLAEGETFHFDINVMGHSRGAITAYYMLELMNSWLEYVKTTEELDYDKIALAYTDGNIQAAKKIIKNIKKIECDFNLLGFDPVEGQYKIGGGGLRDWVLNGTNTALNLEINGFDKKFQPQCNEMPARVKKAQLFLAESERRAGFRPTIAAFHPNTEVSYKLKLGTHSTMTGNTGTDNGPVQSNLTGEYESYRENEFIREAALAVIDEVRLDTSLFMFEENNLPPLQRHTLRRIFRDDEKQEFVYSLTQSFLQKEINQALESNLEGFKTYYNEIKKDFPNDNTSDNNNVSIKCSEWLMDHDPVLTQKVYFILKKEIHDKYLNPSTPQEKELLSQWQDEMKLDSTNVWEGFLSGKDYKIPLQPEPKQRQIYLRNNSVCLGPEPIYNVLPEFSANSQNIISRSIVGGQNPFDTFTEPFQVHLSEILGLQNYAPNKVENINFVPLVELDMAFSKINEFAIKAKQKQEGLNTTTNVNQDIMQPNENNNIKLREHLINFLQKLKNAPLSLDLKAHALGKLVDLIFDLPGFTKESLNNLTLEEFLRENLSSVDKETLLELAFYSINNDIYSFNQNKNIADARGFIEGYIEDMLKIVNTYIEGFNKPVASSSSWLGWAASTANKVISQATQKTPHPGAVAFKGELVRLRNEIPNDNLIELFTKVEQAVERASNLKPRSLAGVASTIATKITDEAQERKTMYDTYKKDLEKCSKISAIFDGQNRNAQRNRPGR